MLALRALAVTVTLMKLPNLDHNSGVLRPVWRGRLHAAAALVAVPAGVLLVLGASTLSQRVAAAVFVVSLVAVYATSAAYHQLARSPSLQARFKRADHAMIYVLIAGTYTPLAMLALPSGATVPVMVAVWLVAGCGVVLRVLWKAEKFASALYLLLGWSSLLLLPFAFPAAGAGAMMLFAAGGVLYTIGAVLFFTNRPRLRPAVFGYHELWHSFTIAAGAAHFAAVAALVGA